MGRTVSSAVVTLTCLIMVVAGCSKKTTKIDPLPEVEPPVQEVVQPPVEEPRFEPQDMDEEMRRVLVPVYFDYDRYSLRAEAVATLERIAAFLETNRGVRILIQGHADERGTDEYNMGLGENRARTARNFLTGYGIDAGRLEMVSFGKARPVNPACPDEACHQLNRRVEWQVLAR